MAQNRNDRYRPVLGFCAGLMALSLLAFAWRPAPPPVEAAAPPPPDSVKGLPPPPAPLPEPEPEPAPVPEPPARLPDLPEGEPSRLVVHGDRSCPQVALTYDAGSTADGAAAILDVLKVHGVTATFFLTGRWVEKYPDLAQRIAAEGHEIANHSYSHPDLTKLPADQVLAEVKQGEEAIRRITGQETRPLFREPFGAFSEPQRRLVRQAGYSYSIYWDVDTLDWQFPPVKTLLDRIIAKSRSGSIVLMHLGVPDSAIASDLAIPRLRSQGYHLVTVTELLTCDTGE